MSGFQLLVVAGTHGNEINASWLIDNWMKNPNLIRTNGINHVQVIGNPVARNAGLRYIDRDLNRSFCKKLLLNSEVQDLEVIRARELLDLYGPNGSKPCKIVIDLHSTTASMGTSLVVYGRRPADLALASLLQFHLGLPIYLHENDMEQQGFLVESWPCGCVIEIGPVPQGLLRASVVEKNRLALETCFELIAKFCLGEVHFPTKLVVHKHLGSVDFPRDLEGKPKACIHQDLDGKDWKPIFKGDPMFVALDGKVFRYQENESLVPVFINEAAYAEKNIAMSFTKREVWTFLKEWEDAFKELYS